MRLSVLLVAMLASAAPATSQGPAPAPAVETSATQQGDNCRRASSYHANSGSAYRGEALEPQKLTELPAGAAYMAVYRTINGCEEPMTLTEYRTGRRP